MSDVEILKRLKRMRDNSDQKMQDLLWLKEHGIKIQADDGLTMEDRIQREYDSTQSLERTMAAIRSQLP